MLGLGELAEATIRTTNPLFWLFCEPNEYHFVVLDMFFCGFHHFILRPLRCREVMFGIKRRYFVSLNNLRVYHISKINSHLNERNSRVAPAVRNRRYKTNANSLNAAGNCDPCFLLGRGGEGS